MIALRKSVSYVTGRTGEGKKVRMKKKLIVLAGILLAAVGLLYFGLRKNIDLSVMNVYETEHFTLYYESLEPETIRDIEQTLEEKYPGFQDFFGLPDGPKGRIVVYASVDRFQKAYLGTILSLFYGDWASGAAYGDMVLVTSPENPGSGHTYEETMEIIVHEYVHTLVYRLNEMPDAWLDEGMATYLAGQRSDLTAPVPGFDEMQRQNVDYAYSYAYVDYLIAKYGSDRVIALIASNDYEGVLGKSSLEVYNDWVKYLNQ
jgi:hypothetical protein